MQKRKLKKLVIILNKISIILIVTIIHTSNIHNAYSHQNKTQQIKYKNNHKGEKDIEKNIKTIKKNTNISEIITITTTQNLPFIIHDTSNTLTTYAPTSDSSEYLKNIPGFSSLRNGGTNGDVVFRGMFGSRLRTLVNNGEILGACAARMDTSSAYIYPDNFDSITIIKGPQTVLWGPVCSAGLLRFERNTPILKNQKLKINNNITIGSNGRLDNCINTTWVNKYYYLRWIGNTSYSKNYKDSYRKHIPSSWNKWNSDLIIGLTPISTTKLEITLGQGNGNALYAGRSMDGTQFKRNSFSLNIEKNNISRIINSIEIEYWDHHVNHIMENSIKNNTSKTNSENYNIKNNIDRLTWGHRSIISWIISNSQLQTGIDLQINQHRKKHDDHWKNDTIYEDIGLFAELNWQQSLSSKLIGGTRLEQTTVKNNIDNILKIRKKIYPAMFLRYENNIESLSIKTYAGIGVNERFPDYWELITFKSGRNIGNDAFFRLKTEKNTQIDIGGYIQKKFTNIWISSYAGYIKDFILFRYNIPQMSSSYAENVNAKILGTEIGIKHNINKNWTLQSNLAWALGKNISNKTPLPQIPPLEAKIISIWKKNKWTITNLLRLVNSQKRISINDGNIISKDHTYSKKFGLLSSYLEWNSSKNLVLKIGIDNILNKYYTEHLNLKENPRFNKNSTNNPLAEPGRTFWIKSKYSF